MRRLVTALASAAVLLALAEAARAYGVHGGARLRHLVLRSASPQIMAGARQALSIGIILMVISEMFAASNGLGFAVVQFQRSFAIPEMWSGILVLGLLGVTLSLVFRAVEVRVLGWYYGLQKLKVTVLFVTHDIDEAVYLGQRVLILSSSPTVVQEQLVIDLPAERNQLHTRADARFASLRTHVYEQIQAAKAARSLETVSFDV
jgi:hypothetical protein